MAQPSRAYLFIVYLLDRLAKTELQSIIDLCEVKLKEKKSEE